MRAVFIFLLMCASRALAQLSASAPADPDSIAARLQEDSSRTAKAWISSQDARTRAWAAYLVLRDRITAQIPDLLSLAVEYNVLNGAPASLAETDDHNAMLAVLDAMIQMNADVPADTAAKLYPEFQAQSMILLARSTGDTTPVLLQIFQTEAAHQGAWLAAGNLLVQRRPPGFAAAVLSKLTVRAQVWVTNGQGFGSGQGGGIGGGVFSEPHSGWPEIGTYSLSACGSANNVVLVEGDHPAYYSRSVDNLYRPVFDSACVGAPPTDETRADYLGNLLSAERGNPPIPSQLTHTIVWSSNADYLDDITTFINDQQTLFVQVAQRLQSAGLLTDSEAKTSRPTLAVDVNDMRGTNSPALVQPVSLPDNVLFSTQ